MRIKLPLLNNQQIYVEDKKSIVLVGEYSTVAEPPNP